MSKYVYKEKSARLLSNIISQRLKRNNHDINNNIHSTVKMRIQVILNAAFASMAMAAAVAPRQGQGKVSF
jgi:hypothetical protein